jgi:hypothetical protein
MVRFHYLQKYILPNTSPPSREAFDAGMEGVDDAEKRKDWKVECEVQCS